MSGVTKRKGSQLGISLPVAGRAGRRQRGPGVPTTSHLLTLGEGGGSGSELHGPERSVVRVGWEEAAPLKAGPAIQGVLSRLGLRGFVRTKWGLPVLGAGGRPEVPSAAQRSRCGQGRASRALRPSLQPPPR